MKTLFLKSGVLFCRTEQGEFEVENPNEIFIDPERKRNNTDLYIGYKLVDGIEWLGEIEVIESEECGHPCEDYIDVCQYSGCGYKGRKLIRLLPKRDSKSLIDVIEKKSAQLEAEHKSRLTGDLSVQSNAQHPNSAHRFTEGADYGDACPKCGRPVVVKGVRMICERCDPPVESQEELWLIIMNRTAYANLNVNEAIKELMSRFTITRKP